MADIRKVTPPNFPTASDNYQRSWIDQYSNVLRLFLNNVSNAINSVIDESSGTVESLATHRSETDPHTSLISDLTAATAVAETDLVMISQSGTNKQATVDQLGDAIFGDDWDDLVVPGTAINPPGGASDPTLNSTTGLLEFSGSADNVIVFVWQLPHGWSGAWDASLAVVIPHLHVRHLTANTNTSRWKFEYDKASVNGSFANAYGSFTTHGTVSKTNPNDTTISGIVSFGNLDLTGHGVSTVVHGRVSRLASSDAADNDASVIALYSADLHIRRRRWGTESEYTTP